MLTITTAPDPIVFHRDLIYFEITTDMITAGVADEENLSLRVEVKFFHEGDPTTTLTVLTIPFNSAGIATLSLQDMMPLTTTPVSADSLQNGTAGVAKTMAGTFFIDAYEQWGFPAVPNSVGVASSEIRVVYGQSRFGYGFGPVASSWMLHAFYSGDNLSFAREVRADQPEYLYVFAYSPITITPSVTLHYTDGTVDSDTGSATTLEADKVNYIPVSLTDLDITPDAAKDLSFYLVTLDGLPLSSNRTVFYQLDDHASDYDHYLLYDNGMGGCEVLRCSGKKDRSIKSSKTTLRTTRWANMDYQQGLIRQSSTEGQEYIKVNTGYYSKEYCDHLSQLLLANAWYIDMTRQIPYAIIIEDTELVTSTEDDDLYSLEFTYRLAWSRSSMSNFQPSIIAAV